MARPALTMTEQAAWHTTPDETVRAFELADGGRWLVTVRQDGPRIQPLRSSGAELMLDVVMPFDVSALGGALAGLGPVARFRNPNLWDALGTAIIRQVIRAAQAKNLYRAFCAAYGEQVTGVPCVLFPTPETVLGLSDEQFASIGMNFKRRPLRAAAEAYLESGYKWRQLDPEVLVDELQTVPRVGPWTAGAAVADWSNDFALYPYADLAVRTWALRAAPDHPWPDDEASFAQRWRALAGERLSDLTLLTLAWGFHHGSTG